MKYEYECVDHGRFRSDVRADNHPCYRMGCERLARRVWGFQYKPAFQSHYNPSVGLEVSSQSQLRSELSRAAELASQPTTLVDDNGNTHIINRPEHNYVPVDWRDKERLGVTNDGLDATYDRLRQQGKDDQAKRLKALMDD